MSLHCHESSPCSGKVYGKCLDVKLTGKCQAKCSFCIEKGGYNPDMKMSVKRLAALILKHPAKNILLVGGEPTLYKHLGELLGLICNQGKKIYLTTNGIALTKEFINDNYLGLLDGLNISIHSPDEEKNARILHNKGLHFEELRVALSSMAKTFNIRINCNLTKEGVSSTKDVIEMIGLARGLYAQEIRFCELQETTEANGYVRARDIPFFVEHKLAAHEPFTEGCLQSMNRWGDIIVSCKTACGFVCPERITPLTDEGRDPKTWVLYPDGTITKGWVCERKKPESEEEDDDVSGVEKNRGRGA